MSKRKRLLSKIGCVIIALVILGGLFLFPCMAITLEESFSSSVYFNYGSVNNLGMQYTRKNCRAATSGYNGYHYVRAYICKRLSSEMMADTGRVYSYGDVGTTARTSWILINPGDEYYHFGTAYAFYGT